MRRLRFKEMLVLLPLFLVWIMFQISHYHRYTLLRGKTLQITSFKRVNSTNKRLQSVAGDHPSVSPLNWMPPPDVLDKNYDDDFHEFLKPVDKNKKNTSPKKLWFMRGGSIWPETITIDLQNELWPEQSTGDRIVEQLMYSPKNYSSEWSVPSPLGKFKLYDSNRNSLRRILLIGDFSQDKIAPGRSVFWQNKCPVNTCTFVTTLKEARGTDVVVFKGKYLKGVDFFVRRRPDHVWILLIDPTLDPDLGNMKHVINWTASYRHDSDIVIPSGKFVPYKITSMYAPEVKTARKTSNKNFAASKTKKVAWFVPNCDSKDRRLQYAKTLSRYIEVDMYGRCGNKKCPYKLNNKCLDLLDKYYKFYLSFEKISCKEYITDVFFEDGLKHNVLPIVMGPPREDYDRIAPPHSFIHVSDFATPRELADYLHVLDGNDTLYNEYFKWKDVGELINTHFWCRLCALLHSSRGHKSYEDVQTWWTASNSCRT